VEVQLQYHFSIRYSSNRRLSGSKSWSGLFTPWKETLYPLWAQWPVPTGAENLVPTPGFNPQTIQPVASSYTDVKKAYRGSGGSSTIPPALKGHQWLTSSPSWFTPGKETQYQLTEAGCAPEPI